MGGRAARREPSEPCLSWQTLLSRGTFAVSAERPAAAGSGWAAVILGAGWAFYFFPPLLPFRKHILPFLPGAEAKGAAGQRDPMTELGCDRARTNYFREAPVISTEQKHPAQVVKYSLFLFSPSTLAGFRLHKAVIKKNTRSGVREEQCLNAIRAN